MGGKISWQTNRVWDVPTNIMSQTVGHFASCAAHALAYVLANVCKRKSDSRRRTDVMTIEKAYEKFYKLLEQIDNSDIPTSSQFEMYQNMESEIEQKKQRAYADMYE